jgi:hypothetical protein
MRQHMTFANVLAVITAVVGLPSSLAFYFGGQAIIAVLVLLLVAGVVGGTLYWRWHTNQPNLTMVRVDKSLTFDDSEGHSATQRSEMKLRANQKGVQMFSLAGFSADGPVQDILVNDRPPARQEVRAGEIAIVHEFPHPLERGETQRRGLGTA